VPNVIGNSDVVAVVQLVDLPSFDVDIPVVVIGAGACGLIAALATHDAGAEVLVLERDAQPGGSTALSSGLIPACETRWQRVAQVEDNVSLMQADVLAKAHHYTVT
jgi:fumarate reductase flavoprotein subunit